MIVALPTWCGVTIPFESTVATEESEDVHETAVLDGVSLGFSAWTLATNWTGSAFSSKRSPVWLIETPATGITVSWTVIVKYSFASGLSTDVTTIVATPKSTGEITPFWLTVTASVFVDSQVRDLSVAFSGKTVAWSWTGSLSFEIVICFWPTEIDSTRITESSTLTRHVSNLSGVETDWTVIIVVPLATAVTTPLSETVATAVLLDLNVTDLSVAFAGKTVAVNVSLWPTTSSRDAALNEIDSTATFCSSFCSSSFCESGVKSIGFVKKSHPAKPPSDIAATQTNNDFFIFFIFKFPF